MSRHHHQKATYIYTVVANLIIKKNNNKNNNNNKLASIYKPYIYSHYRFQIFLTEYNFVFFSFHFIIFLFYFSLFSLSPLSLSISLYFLINIISLRIVSNYHNHVCFISIINIYFFFEKKIIFFLNTLYI